MEAPMPARAAALLLLLGLPAAAQEKAPTAPSRLTDAQRLARGDEALNKVRGASERVDTFLAQARAEKDVLRLNCLQEQRGRVQEIAAAAERAATALREAVALRREGADVELAALSLAVRQADDVKGAAAGCIGALPYAPDATRVDELERPARK
jgi:hypothetical protein